MLDLATLVQGRLPDGYPAVEIGDTVRVHVRVVEAVASGRRFSRAW